jgi:hypothetical protein
MIHRFVSWALEVMVRDRGVAWDAAVFRPGTPLGWTLTAARLAVGLAERR